MNISGKGAWALLLGVGFAASAPLAFAQQSSQPGANANAPTEQLERIEVTGSYIRRADTETPSPVQVITAEDIKQTGYTTVQDVLNNITANNQGTLSQGFAGAFASGASGVSLRGLTVGSTLVLIDGHRMAPYPLSDDGQRSFVDLASIPIDAIERIDVLKDGASALYGSDAIAGVVNIVLKKSYKGAQISAEMGWSQLGGGQTTAVTGTIGFGDLAEDGQNGFVTVEYHHQDPILMSQRPDLYRQNWNALGGINAQLGANNLPLVPVPASATGYFVDPNLTIPAGVNPFNYYGYLPGCNGKMQYANQCMFTNQYWQQVEPSTQRIDVLGRYTRKLNADWELQLTASLFQSSDTSLAAFNPPFSTGATSGFGEQAALVNGKGTVTTYTTPGSYQAPIPNTPAGRAIAAQFGVPVGTEMPIQITLNDIGAPVSAVVTNTYRLVAETKGTLGGWDVDASYGWSEAVTNETNTGDPNLAALFTDLYNGTYIPGTQNSPSVISQIAPPIYSTFTDSLYFVDAHGNRDLFALPGGNLSLALGANFFFRSLDAMPSIQGLSGVQGTFAGDAYAEGNQGDSSVFTEIVAPVLKQLELDGALRFDHYTTGVSATTPKFGFKFTPIEQIAVRGTYSKGFRAPNPVETSTSGSLGFFGFVNDPILCPHPAVPDTPGNFPSQCSIPGTALTVGTAGLQPERSRSYTGGIILEPARGHNFSIDYYDILLSNQIISGLAVPSVVATSPISRGGQATLPFVEPNGTIGSAQTPVGLFAGYLVPYLNLNSTETRGLEYEIKDNFNLGPYGKVKTDLMWTYMVDYLYTTATGTYNLAGTHGPSEISGDTGTPRNRGKFILTWSQGPVEVTGTLNYIGPYSVTDPSAGLFTCTESLNFAATPGGSYFPTGTTPPSQYCEVPSFTDLDLYSGWQLDKNWNLHASIMNVFGREPPIDIQSYGSTNFNPSLHIEGAIGRFFNVGFSYKF